VEGIQRVLPLQTYTHWHRRRMPGSKVVVVETEEYLQKRRKELTSHGLFDDVPMEEDSQAGAPAVAEEHDEVKRQIEAIRGEVDDLNAQVGALRAL